MSRWSLFWYSAKVFAIYTYFQVIILCFTLQNEKIRERLKESQERIKDLEEKLAETRDAHARERDARRTLENEREKMNVFLERMGEGLRSLAVQPHSSNSHSQPIVTSTPLPQITLPIPVSLNKYYENINNTHRSS